jgi:mRNA interferase MazF
LIKGDLILVPFPFTDLSSSKNRPALVLISSREDVTVAFLSTQLRWRELNDVLVEPANTNGLKKPSLVRLAKLATLDQELALGKLGAVDNQTLQAVNQGLKQLFQLAE